MRIGHSQQGSVLVISLIILLVMTLLGVSAMTNSGLQERMVSNQKQMIEASMAAEAGVLTAVQWLRAHPEAWGDARSWKANGGLATDPPKAPNFGDGPVYWIEHIGFNGDTAIIISRGGVLVADRIMGHGTVTVALRNEHARTAPKHDSVAPGNDKARGGAGSHASDDLPLGLRQEESRTDAKTVDNGSRVAAGPSPRHSDVHPNASENETGTIVPANLSREAKRPGKVIMWRQSAPYKQ